MKPLGLRRIKTGPKFIFSMEEGQIQTQNLLIHGPIKGDAFYETNSLTNSKRLHCAKFYATKIRAIELSSSCTKPLN